MEESINNTVSKADSEDFMAYSQNLISTMIKNLKELSYYADTKKCSRLMQPLLNDLLNTCYYSMNIGTTNQEDEGELFVLKTLGQNAPQNAVVFDVGASVGNFSSSIINSFPKGVTLHSFEPSDSAYKKIKERFSAYPNVNVHKLAVSNTSGSADLFSDSLGSELSSLHKRELDHVGIKFEAKETVQVTTVDEFCKTNNINSIYFLKLDVEGNEIKSLLGAGNMILDEKIDFIQFEFGCNLDSRTYLRDFFKLLEHKYVICRILRNEVFPIDTYNEVNEIFRYSNFLAMSKKILPKG